jgi:hypothetical protein
MTGTNHGMTGAVIALLVKEPVVAIPLSFMSHFVCDAIPHFGVNDKPGEPDDELFSKKFNIILICDFLLAVSIMVVLAFWFPSQKWVIWFSMVAAAIPDVMAAYTRLYLERVKKQPYKKEKHFSSRIQWSQTYKGAYVEAVWFVLMGWIILLKR